MQNAFDELEWNFLKMMVHKIGLGNNLEALLEAVYKDLIAKIQMNDMTTDSIQIFWGGLTGLSFITIIVQYFY